MTEQKFLARLKDAMRKDRNLRRGQAAFNLLFALDEAEAERWRGSYHDPFYDDKKMPLFLHVLRGGWFTGNRPESQQEDPSNGQADV